MKAKLALFLMLVGIAKADPEFVGYLSTRESGTLFAVIPSAGAQTRWVKLEGSFDGYSVAEFRAKDEILVVKKDGRALRLKLKAAKVRDGAASSAEMMIVDAAKKTVARMDKWDSDVGYQAGKAEDGFWYVIATKVVDGRKEVRRIRVTTDGKATNYSTLTVEDAR